MNAKCVQIGTGIPRLNSTSPLPICGVPATTMPNNMSVCCADGQPIKEKNCHWYCATNIKTLVAFETCLNGEAGVNATTQYYQPGFCQLASTKSKLNVTTTTQSPRTQSPRTQSPTTATDAPASTSSKPSNATNIRLPGKFIAFALLFLLPMLIGTASASCTTFNKDVTYTKSGHPIIAGNSVTCQVIGCQVVTFMISSEDTIISPPTDPKGLTVISKGAPDMKFIDGSYRYEMQSYLGVRSDQGFYPVFMPTLSCVNGTWSGCGNGDPKDGDLVEACTLVELVDNGIDGEWSIVSGS